MLMAYVDGELEPADRQRLEEHLEQCDDCRQGLEEHRSLQEELAMVTFKEPTEEELERYWANVYNRMERRLGWLLFSIGIIVLLCYGAFKLIESFLSNPAVSFALKVGVVAVVFGGIILLVSLVRERMTVSKVDKYTREVKR